MKTKVTISRGGMDFLKEVQGEINAKRQEEKLRRLAKLEEEMKRNRPEYNRYSLGRLDSPAMQRKRVRRDNRNSNKLSCIQALQCVTSG